MSPILQAADGGLDLRSGPGYAGEVPLALLVFFQNLDVVRAAAGFLRIKLGSRQPRRAAIHPPDFLSFRSQAINSAVGMGWAMR